MTEASYKNSAIVWFSVFTLLSIQAGMLGYAATRHSPTLNEPRQLVAGLSHWKFGRYELGRVNPPLVRMIAVAPILALAHEEDWSGFEEYPGARPGFQVGLRFVEANGRRAVWLFTVARWACIPICLLGGLLCFLWSRELWGRNSCGLVSLSLWTFDPNILAHGELITCDCAATSFGIGACYFYWRWLKRPCWTRVVAAGIMLGLAQLSKMTWVILFVLWPILWWGWQSSIRGKRIDGRPNQKMCMLQILSVLATGLYVLNLGYGFDGTGSQLKQYSFVSRSLTGLAEPGMVGNRFRDSVLGQFPLPLPRQYILGIDVQKEDFEDWNAPSYLCGEWKRDGWWYYYLYGLAVKTPHGAQMLLLASLWLLTKRDHRSDVWSFGDVAMVLVPAVALMTLVSSQTEFNHHVRYTLPAWGLLLVFSGLSAKLLPEFIEPEQEIHELRDRSFKRTQVSTASL